MYSKGNKKSPGHFLSFVNVYMTVFNSTREKFHEQLNKKSN